MKIKGNFTIELNKTELLAIHSLLGEMSHTEYEKLGVEEKDENVLSELYDLIDDLII